MKEILRTTHFTLYQKNENCFHIVPWSVTDQSGVDEYYSDDKAAREKCLKLQDTVDEWNRILWPDIQVKGRHD